jgi:hypothetical protein
MTTRTMRIGNSEVIVRSPLGVAFMSPEDQNAWFSRELEARNPIVLRIVDAVEAIANQVSSEVSEQKSLG